MILLTGFVWKSVLSPTQNCQESSKILIELLDRNIVTSSGEAQELKTLSEQHMGGLG